MINIIQNEIYKLFAKKRLYIYFSIIFFIIFLNLVLALIANGKISGVSCGQMFPLAVFGWAASFVIPVFIIDMITILITDEYADGSLKLSLLRQISRGKLLLGKMASIFSVIIFLLLFILLLSYGLGTALLGWGDNFTISGRIFSSFGGVSFTLLTYGLSLISYMSFAMIIILLAVIINNPASVSILGIGLLVLLLSVGQFIPMLSPFLITSYFNTYNILTSGASVKVIVLEFVFVAFYGMVFYILSSTIFKRKDILI